MVWRALIVALLLGSDEREWADFLDRWTQGSVVDAEAPPLVRIERRQQEIFRARATAERATVHFGIGSAELGPEAKTALLEFALLARDLPGIHFQLAGHTDSVPMRFGSNRELSIARAQHARRFLIRAGVPAELLSIAGYADTAPIASNDEPEGRAQNRRVDVRFVPYELLR